MCNIIRRRMADRIKDKARAFLVGIGYLSQESLQDLPALGTLENLIGGLQEVSWGPEYVDACSVTEDQSRQAERLYEESLRKCALYRIDIEYDQN